MITHYPCYNIQITGERQGNYLQRDSIYKMWCCATTAATGSESIRFNNNEKEFITNLCNDVLMKDLTVQLQVDMI